MGRPEDQKSEEDGSGSKSTAKSKAKQADKEAAELQRKAQQESKIRDRIGSEARAFDVVNRLIEPNLTADYLQQACQYIDHSHFEDVVEERAISHVCGYPLCSNALRQVAKKKYQISTKSNTVYDITARKKFCCNRCYHSSEHLRKQIPETPIWTRRGEDFKAFDFLQHDTRRPLEGEKVISSAMFGLKEEVQLLEKLDKMERRAGRERPAADHCPVSHDESQRLSHHLLSLSTEDDLGAGMQKLSLSADPGDGGEPSSSVPSSSGHELSGGSSSKGVEREVEAQQQGHDASEETQRAPCEKGEKAVSSGSNSALESSVTELTLQDRGDVNGGDSDDDRMGGDTGVSKNQPSGGSGETQDSAVSKPHPAQLRPEGEDSDDEEEDVHDGDVSVNRVTDSDNLPKPQGSGVSITSTDSSHSLATDREVGDTESVADSPKQNERPKEEPLKQQPGESKTAYLMRLLDKRRNLLSKVADVQSDLSSTAEKTEAKTDGSACNAGIDSEADKPKSPESNRRKSEVKENQGHRDSSEQLMEVEENTVVPEASHSPRKKKKTNQARNNPTIKTTAAQSPASPLSAICQVISAWVSAETVDYLGLNAVAGEGEEDRDEAASKFLKDPEMQKKYQNLCQRLAGQEKDFDAVLGEDDLEAEEERRGRKKPLPHYRELQKQAEEFELRVQQFMAGSTTIKSKSAKTKVDGGDGGRAEYERPIALPDIDSRNQMLIRRRIVLERLDHAMPSLLPPLGLSVQDISASLRELVFTFSLSSHNITFKPAEWTLVAMLLLKMLESKCGSVKEAFQSPARCSAFSMVLSRLDHSPASLGQLVQGMLTQHTPAIQA